MQTRTDTYTGKLAYIIYTDTKNVKRKVKSWESWRDQKIEPLDLDNVPTTGFVLNKKVGGNNYCWNPRNTYIRVYDPRGFEFEISVPNLLFILQECSSIKGKGIEGEFVYAWDGTELVLLPTSCEEYKTSSNYTGLQTQKVTKAEIKEGMTYITKSNQRVMYLGRHYWTEMVTDLQAGTEQLVSIKKHIFYNYDPTRFQPKYLVESGFTKLATIQSTECSPEFADKYDELVTQCVNIGNSFAFVKTEFSPYEKWLKVHNPNYPWLASIRFLDKNNYNYNLDCCSNQAMYYNKSSSLTMTTILGNTIVTNHSKPSSYITERLTLEEAKSLQGYRYQVTNTANNQILRTIPS